MKQDKLPVLDISNKLNQLIDLFINDLRQDGFRGDLHEDYASRISTSMDNSVYMVVPELVVFQAQNQMLKLYLN